MNTITKVLTGIVSRVTYHNAAIGRLTRAKGLAVFVGTRKALSMCHSTTGY
ncbi:MAG: hypothetical protein GQ532_03950 [Methylomarinum sp.]|nr:hypothetical protein [Methylomarinum sp.]